MQKQVANVLPLINLDYSAAFIGERPGQSEIDLGRPFVGPSGDLLVNLMSSVGFTRNACLMGNVSQFASHSAWTNEISLEQLNRDIEKCNPNIVVLLGDKALKTAGVNRGVNTFRGSLFKCSDLDSPFYGRKCIASYNPAAVIRQWDYMPLLQFDIRRAFEEAKSPDLELPSRTYHIDLGCQALIDAFRGFKSGDIIACDIEGGIAHGGISCISFAASPFEAYLYAPRNFGDEENIRLLREVGHLLHREDVGFVFQNAVYDSFSLANCWNISVRNIVDDTMISGWEIYPELPKGLGTQVSIYTREPAYKFERKSDSVHVFHEYNCKDSCLTREIRDRHHEILEGPAMDHYQFHMGLLSPTRYIMQRGMKYDQAKADEILSMIRVKQAELMASIEARVGSKINPNSHTQMKDLLYRRMNFEPQYEKEGGKKTDKLTSDTGALLTLYKKHDSQLIYELLKWKQWDGKRKQLVGCDPDGRARGSYNIVGTKTGRYSVSKSPTDNGAALHTITKSNRVCYIADDGRVYFQCDLEGADGWTVAAHCARFGDFNMLDDYKAGIKPAQAVAMMQLHGTHVASMKQAELKELIHETIPKVDKDRWGFLYFSCKRVQHGTNYGLGKITMVDVILKDSWKYMDEPVLMAARDCEKLKMLYLLRYPGVRQWQDWVKEQLYRHKQLTCPSGNTRKFFGRPSASTTIQGAYSHEPQNNTTYATSLALYNLWNDPDNRDGSGNLIIEPLHQVHDALCGQFPIDRADWASRKICDYFNNPITIAGQELVIPFEGEYGPSWGDLSYGKIKA